MLTAYLDESCHDRKDFALVAGFLGSDEQWEACERDWRAALGSRGHLHMNRLRWSNERRIAELLSRLGPIPHKAGLIAMYSAISVSDYEDLIDGTRMQKWMKGYLICVLGIANMISQEVPPNETFKLVLENQFQYSHAVVRSQAGSLDRTSDGRKRWASVEFVEKDDTVLTEPGDYLAYALLQQERDIHSTRARLCAPILQNLRPALARDHRQPLHKPILRQFVLGMTEKFPDLLRIPDDAQ